MVLRHGDRRLALPYACLEGRGLDAGQHLVLLHLRAVIDLDFADIAGKLRADIDADQRADRAGDRDYPAHIALLRGDGLDVELRVGVMLPIIVRASGRQAGDEEDREPTRSHAFVFVRYFPPPLIFTTRVRAAPVTKRQSTQRWNGR